MEASDVIMFVEVIEATKVFRISSVVEFQRWWVLITKIKVT